MIDIVGYWAPAAFGFQPEYFGKTPPSGVSYALVLAIDADRQAEADAARIKELEAQIAARDAVLREAANVTQELKNYHYADWHMSHIALAINLVDRIEAILKE